MKRLLLLLMVAFMGGGVSYGAGVALFGDPGDETASPLEGEGLLVGDLAQGIAFPSAPTPEPSPTPTAFPAQTVVQPAPPQPEDTPSPVSGPVATSARSGPSPTPTPDPFAKCDKQEDRQDRKECRDEVKEDLASEGGKGKQKIECSGDEAQCVTKEK